ncbi:unnamed protein product [Brachionus calyciflorus]|uniref:Peptidase S1 domain-containing protein n=1 Tax=Brachionus calyciflorus TaxID=104777 RepID=A0A814BPB2_9BILA|nr:unnamed protein product [Brachionus calyciflorus]
MKFLNFAFLFLLLQTFSILNKVIAQFDFECGVPDVKSQTKIVNGKVALDNAWPWMAAIYMDFSFICGGSIIAPDLIITAAHCVDDEAFFGYEFVYGTNKISSYNFLGETASKIYIHPDYFSSVIYNDIALIKLTKKIKFSKKVKPICLPTSEKLDEIEKKKVVATGWGKTDGGSFTYTSDRLLQTSLIIKNNKSREGCEHRRYNNYCTKGASFDSGLCQGDSGGPLQYFKNGKWYLYGIASFVKANAEDSCMISMPSFFTTVPFYLNWIKRVATGKSPQSSVKKNCGVTTQKKVVGGTVTQNNTWPWIVQIRFKNRILDFLLSGTLISNQHVLTLNNELFEWSNLQKIFVALGSNELYYYPDSDKLYSVISVKIISPDLVVLKLHRPVTNPNVSPICLPNSKQSSLILNKEIVTAGWGSIGRTIDSSSPSLIETKLTVNNDASECKKYSSLSYCTFGNESNICFGDTGNPVMYLVGKRWTIFGVYYHFTTDKTGKKCDITKMSVAYNVVKYVDSIKSALK